MVDRERQCMAEAAKRERMISVKIEEESKCTLSLQLIHTTVVTYFTAVKKKKRHREKGGGYDHTQFKPILLYHINLLQSLITKFKF